MSASLVAERAALERENAALKKTVETLRSERNKENSMNLALRRLEDKACIAAEDIVQRFRMLQHIVDEFAAEMNRLLQNPSDRDRVIRAMKTTGEAQAFRAALTQNSALRELVMQPLSNESHVWTVSIWQFLLAKIFSYDGLRTFYSSTGQNAAYYIKNIDEIHRLMANENITSTSEDIYVRRLWRKQAMDAVFPTGPAYGYDGELFPKEDHPWLASTRQDNINILGSQILQIFDVFLENVPGRSNRVRELVMQAVHLNECMMHQAEYAWSINLDLTGDSDDAFYNDMDNMDLVAVNTDSGGRVNLKTATKGMRQEDIQSRLYNVCPIKPALRSRQYSTSNTLQLQVGPLVTHVNSSVAVGWALNRNNLKRPENPSMFYIMAQSLGIAPLSRSII